MASIFQTILDLLKGSDTPAADRSTVFKAQLFFWLIGATDGHAKNFSLFLGPGGSYRLTPLYDVLTAQPSLDAGQIQHKEMKLAMSVGTTRHDRIHKINGRHFVQTGIAVGMPKSAVTAAIAEMADTAESTFQKAEASVTKDFPPALHASVSKAVKERIGLLAVSKA